LFGTNFGAIVGLILNPKIFPVPGPILEQLLGSFWGPNLAQFKDPFWSIFWA
jgi:hypothetical protein